MEEMIHLTHTDLDGFGCAVVSSAALGEEKIIRYLHADYHELDKVLEEAAESGTKEILITDLNLNEDQAKFVDECFTKKLLIDHHGTGAKVADRYKWYHLHEGVCATKLLYDFFDLRGKFSGRSSSDREFKKGLEFFVDIVDDYDIWRLEKRDFWNAGAVMTRYVMNPLPVLSLREDRYLKRTMLSALVRGSEWPVNIELSSNLILNMESALKASINKLLPPNVSESIDIKEVLGLDAYTFIAKFQGALFDRYAECIVETKFGKVFVFKDVPNFAAIQYGILTFFELEPEAIVASYSSDKNSVSFRSANMMAREIALAFGGGGHPNAAGSPGGADFSEFVSRLCTLR